MDESARAAVTAIGGRARLLRRGPAMRVHAIRLLSVHVLAVATAASTCGVPLAGGEGRTPHERYVSRLRGAHLDSTALGQDWIAAGQRVLRAPVRATAPLRAQSRFPADEAVALAWRLPVHRGQRLVVHVTIDSSRPPGAHSPIVFVDLFRAAADSTSAPEWLASADSLSLGWTARRDEEVILRVQPELLREVRATIDVRAEATLAFPVLGHTPKSIGSTWGDPRDAGARRHEGIDIFAARGTPALAAAPGLVTFVGTNRLGGNVVFEWLPQLGVSLYYAHLLRQTVHTGQSVRAGDTVGLIDNTGNAATTPSHLHFGIYARGEGAVNPYWFVTTPASPPARTIAGAPLLGEWVRDGRGAPLRAIGAQDDDVIVAPDASAPRSVPARSLRAEPPTSRAR